MSQIPRWKRWYHIALPALASCALVSIVLGVLFHSWPNIWFGAFCFGGFFRGVLDRDVRRPS